MNKEENEGCGILWTIGGGLFIFLIWVLMRMAEGRTFAEGAMDQLYAIGSLILLFGGAYVAFKIMFSSE